MCVPVSPGKMTHSYILERHKPCPHCSLWTQHPTSPLTQESPAHRQKDRHRGPKRTGMVLPGNEVRNAVFRDCEEGLMAEHLPSLWEALDSTLTTQGEKRVTIGHVTPVTHFSELHLKSNQLREMYFTIHRKTDGKTPPESPEFTRQLQSLLANNDHHAQFSRNGPTN